MPALYILAVPKILTTPHFESHIGMEVADVFIVLWIGGGFRRRDGFCWGMQFTFVIVVIASRVLDFFSLSFLWIP